jgi:hypothetical protein
VADEVALIDLPRIVGRLPSSSPFIGAQLDLVAMTVPQVRPFPRVRPSRGSDLVASLLLPSDGEYFLVDGMPRRLRLQYPDAICHLMARGNGRPDIVCDDVDRDRRRVHLGRAANRCSRTG